MYPHLFKTEDWLTSVIYQTKGLTSMADYMLLNEDSASDYTIECESLAKELNLYYDQATIINLDNELKNGQFDSTKTPMLNRYTRIVGDKFGELWRVGDKFTAICDAWLLNHPKFELKNNLPVIYTAVDREYISFMSRKRQLCDQSRIRKSKIYDPKYYGLYCAISEIKEFFWFIKLGGDVDSRPNLNRVLYKYDDQANVVENKLNRLDVEEKTNFSQSEPRFTWGGKKQELAELVWAIYKSERLIDGKTGRPATQKEVRLYFESIFNHSIDVMGLLSGIKRSDKGSDGVTFTGRLYDLVNKHISDEKKRSRL